MDSQSLGDPFTLATVSFDQLTPTVMQNEDLSYYEIPTGLILYRAVTAKISNDAINYRPGKKFTFVGDLQCAIGYLEPDAEYNHQKMIAYTALNGLKLLNMSDSKNYPFIKESLCLEYGDRVGRIKSEWLDYAFSSGKKRTSTVETDDDLMGYLNANLLPEFDGLATFGMNGDDDTKFYNEMAIWNLDKLERVKFHACHFKNKITIHPDHLPPEKAREFICLFKKKIQQK
jgi:hypothetical protein